MKEKRREWRSRDSEEENEGRKRKNKQGGRG